MWLNTLFLALREIRRTRAVPAVLLTAINEGSLRGLEGVETVQVLLQKPFTRRTLERAIATAARARLSGCMLPPAR